MQVMTFEKGGCVAHGIRFDEWQSKFSAWYSELGTMLDCERIDSRGRSYPCTRAQKSALVLRGHAVGIIAARQSNKTT